MQLSRYLKIYACREAPESLMLFSSKKAATIYAPSSILDDIEKDTLLPDDKKTLQGLGFLVEQGTDETLEVGGLIDELNSIDRSFKAVVVMSLDCNLACTYCFEGQRKGNFFMSHETADIFVDYIRDHILPNKDEINIVFYGGEPLLSQELIMHISGRLKELAEDRGIKYITSLITNGVLLTPKVVEKLKPFGLEKAAVTIDGPRQIHDAFRPFKSGKGSFDTIIANLREVSGMIKILLGGNFTRDNYRDFVPLLDYLIEQGITPDRLESVKFDPIFHETVEFAPPEFTGGCVCINDPWLYDASLFLREEILKRGYRTDRVMPGACMMEFNNKVFVNYDGAIYKCPGLMGRQAYKAGDLRTGMVDYRQTHNLDNWKNEHCLSCAYLPLCFGGCRYMKLIRDGNMNGIDCKKPYFDAVLEDLILQDIKYAHQIQK